MALSSSNRYSAKALVSSVLPTPVGPRNKKDPKGRPSSFNPARARRTALATAVTAARWPTTRSPSLSSIASSFSRSPSSIRETGIPVQRSTTSAICSGRTASETNASPSRASASTNCFSSAGSVPYCNSPALAKSPSRLATSSSARPRSSCSFRSRAFSRLSRSICHLAVMPADCCNRSDSSFSNRSSRSLLAASSSFFNASASICNCRIWRSRASNSSGLESTSIRRRLAASSIRSIALSGRKRSVM